MWFPVFIYFYFTHLDIFFLLKYKKTPPILLTVDSYLKIDYIVNSLHFLFGFVISLIFLLCYGNIIKKRKSSDFMAISDSKQRMSLVIEKSDKIILESIAKKDDRSVNYIINQAIKEFIKKNEETKNFLLPAPKCAILGIRKGRTIEAALPPNS